MLKQETESRHKDTSSKELSLLIYYETIDTELTKYMYTGGLLSNPYLLPKYLHTLQKHSSLSPVNQIKMSISTEILRAFSVILRQTIDQSVLSVL